MVDIFGSWGLTPIVTLSLIFALVNKSRAIGRTLIYSQLAAPLSPPLRVCSLREVQSSGPSMRTAGSVSALSSIIKAQKILRPPAACNQIHTFHISDPYFSALGKWFHHHHLLNWTLMASATFISFYLSFSKLSFLQPVSLACTVMHITEFWQIQSKSKLALWVCYESRFHRKPHWVLRCLHRDVWMLPVGSFIEPDCVFLGVENQIWPIRVKYDPNIYLYSFLVKTM